MGTEREDPLKLTSEFVFLNEHFGGSAKKEKSGVKLFLNYQDKTYKIIPAHSEGKSFCSNVLFFENAEAIREMVHAPVARPPETFDFIGQRVPISIISRHKAIAISLFEAIEFAEKELR
jgi:hypothetical protein